MIVLKILAFLFPVALLEDDLLHEAHWVSTVHIFCVEFQHDGEKEQINLEFQLRAQDQGILNVSFGLFVFLGRKRNFFIVENPY